MSEEIKKTVGETLQAWAIKYPDGHFHFWSWGDHRSDIIEAFEQVQDFEWAELQSSGYRAVRVEIREVEE